MATPTDVPERINRLQVEKIFAQWVHCFARDGAEDEEFDDKDPFETPAPVCAAIELLEKDAKNIGEALELLKSASLATRIEEAYHSINHFFSTHADLFKDHGELSKEDEMDMMGKIQDLLESEPALVFGEGYAVPLREFVGEVYDYVDLHWL